MISHFFTRPREAFLFHRTHFPMKQKTAPTVFIHDNRMLAKRAFYCLKTAGAVPLHLL